MTANDQTPWETEGPVGGFEINSTEGCWSKSPRRGFEQRVRSLQRPRKKRQTVISPEQTEVRTVLPPEVPHDTRICIEDLADTDTDESDSDELRVEREVQDESADNRHAKLGPPGLHTTTREPKRAHLRVLAFKTPPKLYDKTPERM